MRIKISLKSAVLRFHGCTPEYINNVCYGRCCTLSGGKKPAMVYVSDKEKVALAEMGVPTKGHFIAPNPDNRCPFHNKICTIHESHQPFGCKLSPFTLNKWKTLVVRKRYIGMCCFIGKKVGGVPAYVAFKRSLVALLGEDQYRVLVEAVARKKDVLHLDIDDGLGADILLSNKKRQARVAGIK